MKRVRSVGEGGAVRVLSRWKCMKGGAIFVGLKG